MLLEPAPHRAATQAAAFPGSPSTVAQVASTIPSSGPHRLSPWDYTGMLAGFALVLAITVVNSRGRLFWEDEMLGWLLLRDPSWHHMIRAWNGGADGGGFSFYLLGRPWFRLFGDSALSFRLFSSTAFGLAFAVTWAALRRFFSLPVVAFAAVNTFFFSPPLTMHFIEGRFYGLLVLSTALALWLDLHLDAAPARIPTRLYLALFCTHALLTTSHVLGVVYSFFALLALVALDHLRHRRRPLLYLAAASSWLLLLPELPSIRAAARVGKPHFWTTPPKLLDLLGAYTGFSPEIFFVLCVLLCAVVLTAVQAPGNPQATLRAHRAHYLPIYVVTVAMLLVPIWFLAEGMVGTWLFTPRYLQPMTLGLAFLTAALLSFAAGHPRLQRARTQWPQVSRLGTGLAALLYIAFTFIWVFHHVSEFTPEAFDFAAALDARLPKNLPVVAEDAFTFAGLMSREPNAGVHYTFLLDWPFAVSPGAPHLEVTQYHLMENWRRAGYFPDHIAPLDPFLAAHPHFLIIHPGPVAKPAKEIKPEIGNPLAERLARLPGWEVRPYFTFDRTAHDSVRDTVYEACRGTCTQYPQLPAGPNRCELLANHEAVCCTGMACPLPPPPAPESVWPWRWKVFAHR